MRRHPFPAWRVAALGLALLLAASAAPAARFPYERGETVQITGVVTDPAGAPLRDIEVVLEASRSGFRWWPPGRVARDVVRGTTRTDARGQFRLEMRWSPRYNKFELMAGVPVHRGPGGERFEVLARTDLARPLQQGSPVTASLVIENVRFVERLREFVASVSSADEQRVYRDQGKPDRVDRHTGPTGNETAWWYFERGKVYRFVDGSLRRVDDFDPVEPLAASR